MSVSGLSKIEDDKPTDRSVGSRSTPSNCTTDGNAPIFPIRNMAAIAAPPFFAPTRAPRDVLANIASKRPGATDLRSVQSLAYVTRIVLLFGDRDRRPLTSSQLQRVGPVAELPGLLGELGTNVAEAFEGSGLDPCDLKPEARISYPSLIGLMERAAVVSRCPSLGLLTGARSDHRALGVIGELMASAPTLGDALRDYVEMQIGYSRSAVVYLQIVEGDHFIGYGLHDNDVSPSRQIHDLVVAIGCNMLRSLTGGRVQPLRTLECVSRPDDPDLYRKVLKAPATFDQEQTAVLLRTDDMAIPLPGADPARRHELRTAILQMARDGLDDVVAQVRRALRPRLMLGEADRDTIAGVLGLGPRTLTRRLSAAGTSFEAIKDEVRFTVARELLALTRLPIGRVAETLAYSDNSAFNHAFLRWAGMSPSHWRNQQKSDDERALVTPDAT